MRDHYPDLIVQYESRGELYVAEAEWRESTRWVHENDQWVIRLWPKGGKNPLDFIGHLFNRQSLARFKMCRVALVSEARSVIHRHSHA